MKNKQLIILLLLFITVTKSFAQEFKGYYMEVLYKSNKKIINGEFILNNNELLQLLKSPDDIWSDKYKRIHNYCGKTFNLLKLQLPDSIENIEQLNWNKKVSLYRGNDDNPYYIFHSQIDNRYFFFIKKIAIQTTFIGDQKQIYEMSAFNVEIIGCPDCSQINYESNEHFLLNKIIFQELLTDSDIDKLKINDLIKSINSDKAINEFPIKNKSW